MIKNQVLPNVDLSRYVGEWVVICDDKVVGHDKNLVRLQKEIDDCKKAPTIAKIPKKETLIF